jgi:hypothetical protein
MQVLETIQKGDSFLASKNPPTESGGSRSAHTYHRGHWKASEKQRYFAFLWRNYHIMRSSRLRYHYKIFNSMAVEIGTRSSAQCKSHHQKMLKRAGNRIENMLMIDVPAHPSQQPKEPQ